MFEITLITVGKLKEKFYLSAAEEYSKLMDGIADETFAGANNDFYYNKVKEFAKEGKCKRPLKINKKFDYKFVVEYLTNALGYILTDFNETEDSIEFTLNW